LRWLIGSAALICGVVLGRRNGYGENQQEKHDRKFAHQFVSVWVVGNWPF
jgi:hypothetical protein